MKKLASIVLLIVFAQTSCTKLDTEAPVSNSNAFLSVTHASPFVQTMQLFMDDQPLRANASLAYGSTTNYTSLKNPYVPVTQGIRKLSIEINQTQLPALGFLENFQGDNLYSLFILDTLENGHLKYLLIRDDFNKSMAVGQIAIRFLNLSSNTPALDLYMVRWGEKDTVKIAANREFPIGEVNTVYKGNKFDYLPWGPYWMEARISGTDSVLMKGGLNAGAGSLFTIYTRGKQGTAGLYRLNVGIIEYHSE